MAGELSSFGLLRGQGIVKGGPVIEPWAAGTNTTLSTTPTRARATENGGNARISRRVSNLVPGATYRVQTNGYVDLAVSGAFFRVSADANLTLGDYMNVGAIGAINDTFVADGSGVAYIGIVGVTDAPGEWVETDLTFTLSRQ